jgi:hypothetical protein
MIRNRNLAIVLGALGVLWVKVLVVELLHNVDSSQSVLAAYKERNVTISYPVDGCPFTRFEG